MSVSPVLRGLFALSFLFFGLLTPSGQAMQLDWNGQFWFDHNWINNYQMSRARPGYDNDAEFTANNTAGYSYVPGAGEKNVTWYSAFFKLQPKLVVNDSVQIKSELHIGSPIYGFLGRGYPSQGNEVYNFTGSQRNSFAVGAQRYWANLITDFGTIELGRAPIHWGLGAIWNSGDELFDRYQSTGDMIRLTSKFGNFTLQPALVKISSGTNVAGASNSAGGVVQGNDDVTDYDLAVKYHNLDEDFQFGLMWTKRTGNKAQNTVYFNTARTGSTRIDFNIFDFFAKKKLGKFWLAGEFPLFSGSIGAVDGINEFDLKSYAFVFEGGYSSDLWDVGLKAGHVPGQPASAAGDTKFRAVYLNNNYNLGLLMFHYNVFGFSMNNPDTLPAGATLQSPYDAGIVNATYATLNPKLKLDKWTLKSALVLAIADETAKSGSRFYNYQRRSFQTAVAEQSNFLGWELDLGAQFNWDENVMVGWDLGFWFPGSFYDFSNSRGVAALDHDMVFGSQVKVGISF